MYRAELAKGVLMPLPVFTLGVRGPARRRLAQMAGEMARRSQSVRVQTEAYERLEEIGMNAQERERRVRLREAQQQAAVRRTPYQRAEDDVVNQLTSQIQVAVELDASYSHDVRGMASGWTFTRARWRKRIIENPVTREMELEIYAVRRTPYQRAEDDVWDDVTFRREPYAPDQTGEALRKVRIRAMGGRISEYTLTDRGVFHRIGPQRPSLCACLKKVGVAVLVMKSGNPERLWRVIVNPTGRLRVADIGNIVQSTSPQQITEPVLIPEDEEI